jgi:glycosyltransferase involved in cell wall biosynthesis
VHFHVIPGHAEHVVSARSDELPSPSRADLKIPADAFLITVVGAVSERKRQHTVLDTIEWLLMRGHTNVHLLVVGAPSRRGESASETPYLVELQMRANDPPLAGHVTLLPFERDAWRYIPLANLHVSAATGDAFPTNTIEAMRLGVPVVAVKAGGVAQQIPDPQTHWMLVPPAESGFALNRAIERALRLHTTNRTALDHLAAMQQRHALGLRERFESSWAQLFDTLDHQTRVNDACGLWSPEAGCRPLTHKVSRPVAG